MHYFTLPEDLALPPTSICLKKGIEYVADDHNTAQIVNIAGGGRMHPCESVLERLRFDDVQDWNGRKILFIRAGGIGDVVLLTPVLREIRRRWPDATIDVATMELYQPVLKGLASVNNVLNYPIEAQKLESYDAIVSLEGAVERNPRARKLHMTDLYAEIAGLKSRPGLAAAGGHPALDDHRAEYVVHPNEMIWLVEQFPRKAGLRRVAVQGSASALCRMYPPEQTFAVVKALHERKWEIFLLGAKGELAKFPEVENVHNCAAMGLSLRQSAAVINSSDVFFGPDSGLLHIAGALQIPAVGLYGPFPYELRTKYADTTFALHGEGTCAPCFFHANPARRQHFPDNCPSKATGRCEVLAKIDPQRIVQKIEQIAKKFELAAL